MILFLAVLLLAPLQTPDFGPDCGTEPMELGRDVVYAWSEKLDGSACRTGSVTADGSAQTVRVEINVASGGYDAGVARNTLPEKVDRTFKAEPLHAHLDVELEGSGHWWAGPKFCICKTPDWQGLEGNWECYIIESADLSPRDLMGIMKATYRGKTIVDGDVYLHYSKPWESWQQLIAIRETYRDEGAMNFAPIVEHWRKNLGLPNWYMHSPKVGLETTGQIKGHFEWTNIQTSDLGAAR